MSEATGKPRVRTEHTAIIPRLGPTDFEECKTLVGPAALPATYEEWCRVVADLEARAKAEWRTVLSVTIKPAVLRTILERRRNKSIVNFDDFLKYAKSSLKFTTRHRNRRRFSLVSLD